MDTSLDKVDAYHLKASTRLSDYSSLPGHTHFFTDPALPQDACDRQFALYSQQRQAYFLRNRLWSSDIYLIMQPLLKMALTPAGIGANRFQVV